MIWLIQSWSNFPVALSPKHLVWRICNTIKYNENMWLKEKGDRYKLLRRIETMNKNNGAKQNKATCTFLSHFRLKCHFVDLFVFVYIYGLKLNQHERCSFFYVAQCLIFFLLFCILNGYLSNAMCRDIFFFWFYSCRDWKIPTHGIDLESCRLMFLRRLL